MSFTVDCKLEKGYIERTKTIDLYFNEIRKFPVLSQSEERELLNIIKNGDEQSSVKAKDRLVKCNQRFVVSVAKRWYNGENMMDIIEEGNLGLLTAIDKYDLERDERFLTYAVFWIRKYINNYVINKQGIVRPSNANKIYTYVNKARSRFYTINERYPTSVELKEMLKQKYGITITDTNEFAHFDVFSLDENNSESEDNGYSGSKVNEAVTLSSNNELDEQHDYAHTQEYVATLLRDNLSEREEYVIRGYYGIGREQESMDVMALNLGVCRERIRQLYNKALDKLKMVG